MKRIVTLGEILVEIMADQPGSGFREPIALTGPYPSGAPAIFISQAARMGADCAMISAVGDDDFGRVNVDRLAADGVDTSAIAVVADRPTGSAFVRYRPDGQRDFVFNIAHSACAAIAPCPAAEAVLVSADHLHLVGTSFVLPGVRTMAVAAAKAMRARGGTVSFDPNLRKELLQRPDLKAAALEVLAVTDLFFPSGDELFLGQEGRTAGDAVQAHLASGIAAVVHKSGAAGADWHGAEGSLHQDAFAVTEVDPTGAGDCFAGAFTSLWLDATAPGEALRLACAAGALAVTRRGPMEGAARLDEIRRFAEGVTWP